MKKVVKITLKITALLVLVIAIDRIISCNTSESYGVDNTHPNGYMESCLTSINSKVSGLGLYGYSNNDITFANGKVHHLMYRQNQIPADYSKIYPNEFKEDEEGYFPIEFIKIGDSIFKKEKTDTFYVIRGNEARMYLLPLAPKFRSLINLN